MQSSRVLVRRHFTGYPVYQDLADYFRVADHSPRIPSLFPITPSRFLKMGGRKVTAVVQNDDACQPPTAMCPTGFRHAFRPAR